VKNILIENGYDPEPDLTVRSTWHEFIKSHWDLLAACDVFTIELLVGHRLIRCKNLAIRKIIVLGLIGLVLLIGNVLFVANWLADKGVVDWAKNIRTEYLTGTAITIVAVLLILLVSPRTKTGGLIRRCPVCEHRLIGSTNYCGDCGSEVP